MSVAWRGRLAPLAREAARFGAVGVSGIFVNLGVYNLLRRYASLLVVQAGVIATAAAVLFNYVGFRYFTYRHCDRSRRARQLLLFLVFSAAGIVIENGVFYATARGLGWSSPLRSSIGKCAGLAMATAFRFWSYRTWVFTMPSAARNPAWPDAEE